MTCAWISDEQSSHYPRMVFGYCGVDHDYALSARTGYNGTCEHLLLSKQLGSTERPGLRGGTPKPYELPFSIYLSYRGRDGLRLAW